MPESFDFATRPHRRRNPLLGDWVLVSPQRNQRPWLGQTEPSAAAILPSHDSSCYLCPGNQRIQGATNPHYKNVFVFANDFPALDNTSSTASQSNDPLLEWHSEQGACRVIAYSPNHSKTLAEMTEAEIALVIACWSDQCAELGEHYPWVQIFENKGEIMGCSMPHPHGQVWAQEHAPTTLSREATAQQQYLDQHASTLLLDYVERELHEQHRIVAENPDWVVVVPFWAAWPFETLLLPRFPIARLTDLNSRQGTNLAAVLRRLLIAYDNLFQCSFPYSMGWHGAPFDNQRHPGWQLHAHFYPPLLRASTVRKFMVGYEMMGEPQRDISPEQAAEALRTQPNVHYKNTQNRVDD